jgi:hypothetical protein
MGLPVMTAGLVKMEREFVGNADLYVKENLFGPSELGGKMPGKEGGFSIRDNEFGQRQGIWRIAERGLEANGKPSERLRAHIMEQHRADTEARRVETEKKKAEQARRERRRQEARERTARQAREARHQKRRDCGEDSETPDEGLD